jgi:hypothetical protein
MSSGAFLRCARAAEVDSAIALAAMNRMCWMVGRIRMESAVGVGE